MKTGKISESVLKRSVLKQVKRGDGIVKSGSGIGKDCAVFACGAPFMATAIQTFMLHRPEEIRNVMLRAANSVAAGGAVPVFVELALSLPEDAQEELIKDIMKAAARTAEEISVEIAGGHTQVAPGLKLPLATASVVGGLENEEISERRAMPGQEIVMTKWAGLEGSFLLAERYPDRLKTRYPMHLIETAAGFGRYLSIAPEAALARGKGVMHDVSGGGVFAALWELAEGSGVGLEADLKKIPVRQETIEVCEYFGVNPYEILSGGSLLVAADDGEELAEAFQSAGIPAAVIGRITEGNARIIVNEDEKRFLERPRADEIDKL